MKKAYRKTNIFKSKTYRKHVKNIKQYSKTKHINTHFKKQILNTKTYTHIKKTCKKHTKKHIHKQKQINTV